jgi:hypothetical protein
MFMHFGWRSALGIEIATAVYYVVFKNELTRLEAARPSTMVSNLSDAQTNDAPVPAWITGVQLGFMAWTVFVAHYPALFVGGFLVFLAFSQATANHQSRLDLKPPLLVGFFPVS